jgi:hypothetical protein
LIDEAYHNLMAGTGGYLKSLWPMIVLTYWLREEEGVMADIIREIKKNIYAPD